MNAINQNKTNQIVNLESWNITIKHNKETNAYDIFASSEDILFKLASYKQLQKAMAVVAAVYDEEERGTKATIFPEDIGTVNTYKSKQWKSLYETPANYAAAIVCGIKHGLFAETDYKDIAQVWIEKAKEEKESNEDSLVNGAEAMKALHLFLSGKDCKPVIELCTNDVDKIVLKNIFNTTVKKSPEDEEKCVRSIADILIETRIKEDSIYKIISYAHQVIECAVFIDKKYKDFSTCSSLINNSAFKDRGAEVNDEIGSIIASYEAVVNPNAKSIRICKEKYVKATFEEIAENSPFKSEITEHRNNEADIVFRWAGSKKATFTTATNEIKHTEKNGFHFLYSIETSKGNTQYVDSLAKRERLRKIAKLEYVTPDMVKTGSIRKVKWECPVCKTTWHASFDEMIDRGMCPVCHVTI